MLILYINSFSLPSDHMRCLHYSLSHCTDDDIEAQRGGVPGPWAWLHALNKALCDCRYSIIYNIVCNWRIEKYSERSFNSHCFDSVIMLIVSITVYMFMVDFFLF